MYDLALLYATGPGRCTKRRSDFKDEIAALRY